MLDEDVVERVASLMGGAVVQHEQLKASRRWTVVRATAAGRPVILKQVRTRKFDWATGTPVEHVRGFSSEVGALRFFAGDPVLAPLVPPLLAADEVTGCIVMSDLGEHGTLADVLLGADPQLARRMMREYAALLALFANRTRLRLDEFDVGRGHATHFAIWQLRERLGGLSLQPDAMTVVHETCDALERAAEWQAVGPGDACPDNVLVTPDGLRLLDFEGATAYHALFDAASIALPFPSCWCQAEFDPATRAEFLAVHRGALEHDDGYEGYLVAVTIVWSLWTLAYWLDAVRDADIPHPVAGLPSWRQRVRAAAHQLANVATSALGAWAANIDEELAQAWPEVQPRGPYPAFAPS